MQDIITLEVLSATSEKRFSLDELVFRTKELFETEGLAGFVGLILRLADERICMNMVQGKIKHDRQSCCSNPQYEHHDQSNRQFRTSVGKVMIRWRRLRCTKCGKSVIPLREFLGLERYQSKTSELEKIVAEIVSEQTYRRSSAHLSTIGSIPVPKSTAHRWVAQSTCDQIDGGNETFDMLVSDGESGIDQSFSKLCNSHQRCHWHCVQDLNYTMWQDKAEKIERRQMQKKLAAIIGIELPEEDFEKVEDSDKTSLAQAVAAAECDVRKLIKKLLDKGYGRAADYLIRASKNMFSYVRRWLLTGIVGPRASSMIERMMRELARRLKRMAFGWSEEGAAKMARIIIKRFTSAGQWEKYWKDRLRIQDNVILALKSIKVKNPQTLGR